MSVVFVGISFSSRSARRKNIMSLRACDAEPYLQLKKQMIESDHDALFSDNRQLPVFIYQKDSQTKYLVELDYQFFEAKLLPGFLRLQRQPGAQPPVVEAPPAEPTKLKGSTWAELKRSAEEQERRARAERYAGQKDQQTGLSAPDPALAAASYSDAQINAARKGQSGPNSKLR